jgi:N-glycosidase YbiA
MNTFPSEFKEGKFVYPSNEHYFQSKKFEGTAKEEYVVQAPTPHEAFDRGNERTGDPLREDWLDVKEQVMKKGLILKFSQNPKLLDKLLETGDRELVENSPKDSYWGIGADRTGKNRLGVILMEIREEFRKQPK